MICLEFGRFIFQTIRSSCQTALFRDYATQQVRQVLTRQTLYSSIAQRGGNRKKGAAVHTCISLNQHVRCDLLYIRPGDQSQNSTVSLSLSLSCSLSLPPLSPEISNPLDTSLVNSRLEYNMCVKSQINQAAILSTQQFYLWFYLSKRKRSELKPN